VADSPNTGTTDASAAQAGAPRRIAVGRINGPWGLQGHVKVTPLTSNPQRLQPGSELIVNGERRHVLDVASPKGYPCVLFDGYHNRNGAETLKGALIEIEEDELPELAPDQYYVHQLIGLQVVTTDGDHLGSLEDVLRTGANDVYLVKRRKAKDILIPAIADVIVRVDLEAGEMLIDALPGLLEG
jgi:16S rRNA processing protein RimM